MLRKTGEGSYAHIHPIDKPDEPERVKKASEEVTREALAHAKRLAEERDLHLPELAVNGGERLVERGFELADKDEMLVIDEKELRRAVEDLSDSDNPSSCTGSARRWTSRRRSPVRGRSPDRGDLEAEHLPAAAIGARSAECDVGQNDAG